MTNLISYLGRDDIVYIDDTGALTTWINQHGSNLGSMAPVWQFAGLTHDGSSSTGVTSKSRVHFGKIWNHQEITTCPYYYAVGADYATVFNVTTPVGVSPHNAYLLVNLWVNGGYGDGARLQGDGDHYCDMRGTGAGTSLITG